MIASLNFPACLYPSCYAISLPFRRWEASGCYSAPFTSFVCDFQGMATCMGVLYQSDSVAPYIVPACGARRYAGVTEWHPGCQDRPAVSMELPEIFSRDKRECVPVDVD